MKKTQNNNYSVNITFDLLHKNETLLLKIHKEEYKVKNITGTTLVSILNNSDKIIEYLNNYISILQRYTLSTFEITNYNMLSLSTLPISQDKFSLLYIMYLNFKNEIEKNTKFNSELLSYIGTITNVHSDNTDIWKTTSVLSFPNVNNNLIINSLQETINNLISFKEKIPNYFKWNLIRDKYIFKEETIKLPVTHKQQKDYYYKNDICSISSLNYLLDVSLYYINLCGFALKKTTDGKYQIIDSCSGKQIEIKENLEELEYFSTNQKRINTIKTYLGKKGLKDLAEADRRQKALKKLNTDLENKQEFLKRKYKKNYKSDECQKILCNWIANYIEENNIYSPSSNKKIGNTNAKKK